jgi:hypothetical protein
VYAWEAQSQAMAIANLTANNALVTDAFERDARKGSAPLTVNVDMA